MHEESCRRRYTNAMRERAVRRRLTDGVSIQEVARELDIPLSTLKYWVANMRSHGTPLAAPRHPADCGCFTCWRNERT